MEVNPRLWWYHQLILVYPVSNILPAVHSAVISGDTIIAVRHGNTRDMLCVHPIILSVRPPMSSELRLIECLPTDRPGPFSIARNVVCTQQRCGCYIASVSSRTSRRISAFQLSPTDVIYSVMYWQIYHSPYHLR